MNKMIRKLYFFLIFIVTINFCLGEVWAQKAHPRGIVMPQDVDALQMKVKKEPWKTMLNQLAETDQRMETQLDDIYQQSDKIGFEGLLYLLTNDVKWATLAFDNLVLLSTEEKIVGNPFSKGLTRARALRDMTYAYDFCFNVWTEEQRRVACNIIYDLMSSVNNSMGKEANYHLESNWMGVRYGSVAFAAHVLDDQYLDQSERIKQLNPFRWDVKERLRDQLVASSSPNGWFMETLGYQVYQWEFICPAIIAMQNYTDGRYFQLEDYAPQLLHSLDQHITATVSMANGHSYGLKPDLGDDNMNMGLLHFAFGIRLMPEALKPHLKWMVNYLTKSDSYQHLFYLLALTPDRLEAKRPEANFLNYYDKTAGVTLFRNEFVDENDIVACFNTSEKRIYGHGGPDNLSFRIMGLGSVWAIGAGRTGEVAGQTNLFPEGDWQKQRGKRTEGKLLEHGFNSDGSGFATGTGSIMGVKNHVRKFTVDYSDSSGAEALFIVKDESDNGRTWRMNTPEFNKLEILDDGFLLTAPNGSTLRAKVDGVKEADITTEKVRYGGSTVVRNPGIGFGHASYEYSTAIDIACEGDITVIMTLQPKGKSHPDMR